MCAHVILPFMNSETQWDGRRHEPDKKSGMSLWAAMSGRVDSLSQEEYKDYLGSLYNAAISRDDDRAFSDHPFTATPEEIAAFTEHNGALTCLIKEITERRVTPDLWMSVLNYGEGLPETTVATYRQTMTH